MSCCYLLWFVEMVSFVLFYTDHPIVNFCDPRIHSWCVSKVQDFITTFFNIRKCVTYYISIHKLRAALRFFHSTPFSSLLTKQDINSKRNTTFLSASKLPNTRTVIDFSSREGRAAALGNALNQYLTEWIQIKVERNEPTPPPAATNNERRRTWTKHIWTLLTKTKSLIQNDWSPRFWRMVW